ncbi:MAG: DUF4442 domain-containing protein [Bdellovibrionota bacterium]
MPTAAPTPIPAWKITWFLRLYGLVYIPLVRFCWPSVIECSNQRTILRLPLRRATKNHLGAMYFGALNIGAELCIAMVAVIKIRESGHRIDFLFKDYKADFLRRAEDDVYFICEEVETVVKQIAEASTSTERINRTMRAYAIVPKVAPAAGASLAGEEKIATFELTLSVRQRKPK